MDGSDTTERLKSALWHALGTNIDSLGLAQDINATPQFIGALTELVWNQIHNATLDVEAFTKHAGRKVIDTQDILLLSRRNSNLMTLLIAKNET